MKKLLLTLTTLCLLLALTVPACAYASGNTPISLITAELEERGFPADFLSGLLEEELRELHRDTLDYIVYFTDAPENGIRIDRGNIPAGELDLTLSVAYLADRDAPDDILRALIFCRYQWLPTPEGGSYYPLSRGCDELTVCWDHTVFSPTETKKGIPLFRRYENNGGGWTLTDTASQPAHADLNSYGFSFDLSADLSTAHRGFVSFKLYPSDSDLDYTISGRTALDFMDVSAQYVHTSAPATPPPLSNLPVPVLLAVFAGALLLLLKTRRNAGG